MIFSIQQKYVFFLCSLLFSVASTPLFSQVSTKSISQLRSALADARYAEHRIDLLNDIAYAYRRKSLDSLGYFARLALRESLKNNYKKGLVLAYKNCGIHSFKSGLPNDSTLIFTRKALHFAIEIEDYYNQAALNNNIGLVKSAENKHRESIKYFLEGLKVLKSLEERPLFLEALLNGNLGVAYRRTNNPELAFEYLEDAVNIARNTKNQSLLSILSSPYGAILIETGEPEEGKRFLYAALPLHESLQDHQSLGNTLMELSSQLINEGQYELAQNFIDRSQSLPLDNSFNTFNIDVIYQKARIEKGLGNISAALQYANEAMNRAREIDHIYLETRCLSLLAQINQQMGRYPEAFAIQQKLMSIKDSLNVVEKSILVEQAEAEYQVSKKEQEISFLNARKRQQSRLIEALSLMILLGIGFVVSLIITQNRSSKDQRIIREKNAQLKDYIEQNLQLENFAHIASHDLKTPLRNIASFSQLLSRKLGDKADEDVKSYLGFISNGSKELMELTNDLLAYSTLNKKELHVEKIAIEQFVEDVLFSIKSRLEETKTQVELHVSVDHIMADAIKLRQVFQNLILNGIKFRQAGTTPQLTISVKDQKSDWLFGIADNGIGIPEEFQDKIFLLLKRLHNREEYEGTGIGLAICKRVIDQHEGRIWVESEPDRGSTFYFTIPKNVMLGPSFH